MLPTDLTRRVWQLVEADQVNDKVIAALAQNSPLGKVLAAGLSNRHRSREALMERLEDTGRHVVHELERFLNTLGTIAGVSPLLGLLGTVGGIIKAFNAINAGGMGDPRLLSGGIAQALITTAAGLCVAIPSLIAYRYLRGPRRSHRHRDREGCDPAGRRAGDSRRPRTRGRAMNLKPRRHEEPEINMVSLIDVVLMMVIFFMLSARFNGEGRLRIRLPQSSAVLGAEHQAAGAGDDRDRRRQLSGQ